MTRCAPTWQPGRSVLRAAAASIFLLVACTAPACASGLLSFEGGGYWIDLQVGQVDVPVIASVRVYRTGDANGVALPAEDVVVGKFDPDHRIVELRFKGAGDAFPIGAFTLSAQDERAVLRIGDERIVSKFDWGM